MAEHHGEEKTKEEIERKWRLKRLPHQALFQDSYVITQAYIIPAPAGPEGTEVRVRKQWCAGEEEEFTLTTKRGKGLVREETTTQISKEEYEKELAKHAGNIIYKQRFVYDYEDENGMGTLEFDVYAEELTGLIILEVEFEDVATAKDFVLPNWVTAHDNAHEVTNDPHYKNVSLASKPVAALVG